MSLHKYILALAAGLIGLQATAQAPEKPEPFRLATTLRVGYSPSTEDNLNRSLLGFGFSAEYSFSSKFSAAAEVGYFYKPGRHYLAPIQAPAAEQPVPDPAYSVDSRKNTLEGVMLRGSARMQLSEVWGLQAGVQIGKTRFRHEYIATIADTDWSYSDTYNGTPTESVLAVHPFVGVRFELDKDSAIDLNVIGISYRSIDFRHTPGSPSVGGDPNIPASQVYEGDTLVKKNRMIPTFELGYTFRF